MKKSVIFLLPALLFLQGRLFAQTSLELIPTGGYTFGDNVNFYNTYGQINESPNWGGSVLFNVNRKFGVELMYNHIATTSATYYYGTHVPLDQENVTIDYFMLGLNQSIDIPHSVVHPFIGMLLGAAAFSPNPVDYSSNTKFAWGAQLGTNIYATPRIGLRLKAQLLSPVDGGGAGFYFGSFGSGVSYSTYSSIYQFGFSAGLVIGLGKVLPESRQRAMRQKQPRPRYYYRSPAPAPYYYYH